MLKVISPPGRSEMRRSDYRWAFHRTSLVLAAVGVIGLVMFELQLVSEDRTGGGAVAAAALAATGFAVSMIAAAPLSPLAKRRLSALIIGMVAVVVVFLISLLP